jgi:peptide/nickel transport system permease protein
VSAGAPELLTGTEDALTIDAQGSEREIAARSPMQLFWRRLRRDKVAMVALGFVILIVATAVLAPVIVNVAGTPQPNITNADLTDDFGQPLGPREGHPFGVDKLGRDVFSRTVYGSRVSLEVAFIATALIVLIGVTVGLIAGYYRGWVDPVVSRITDVMLAFPFLIVAVGLAAILGPSLTNATIALGFAAAPLLIRITRGETLALREEDYVRAAVANGASDPTILRRHILPNMAGTLIVQATVWIPTAIIGEALLSFLGLGVQPPTPSWGVMLAAAQPFIDQAPRLVIYPGLAIFLATLSFNLLGDGLRDVLDPRTQT